MKKLNFLIEKKKPNLTCHFCEHPAKRTGRKSHSEQMICQLSGCGKVYCSTKGCEAKLLYYYKLFTNFQSLKNATEKKLFFFRCPHCINPFLCNGRQCLKKRCIDRASLKILDDGRLSYRKIPSEKIKKRKLKINPKNNHLASFFNMKSIPGPPQQTKKEKKDLSEESSENDVLSVESIEKVLRRNFNVVKAENRIWEK
ncbi:hypothetical protein MHBO_001831 [Bonamia ostreae]|uniref:Zinc-finger domain-containing protein n=1 Tax=Bonamia ostreae TaxID=126728 RepID=A0ABV2AKC0_9EUKA